MNCPECHHPWSSHLAEGCMYYDMQDRKLCGCKSSSGACAAVRKYLDASTGNLPHDEYDRLMLGEAPVIRRGHDYGVWVHVSHDDVDPIEEFPCLSAVLAFARTQGCLWINFDQDAEPVEGLPLFEW